jgi:hypothetical protein
MTTSKQTLKGICLVGHRVENERVKSRPDPYCFPYLILPFFEFVEKIHK